MRKVFSSPSDSVMKKDQFKFLDFIQELEFLIRFNSVSHSFFHSSSSRLLPLMVEPSQGVFMDWFSENPARFNPHTFKFDWIG
ncbi:hypothetical protein MJO28_006531 [Puccinia striiformis f. sp. tritici]|uniref:Uncharacterized protein n=1 Tax=Puccinia striiformis f. sp. tritici TaxID=168172 RepID=A0ACC0EHN9_9BASI|nr:hypothetical protein MJO28_006531 [Puccinia striiformis f. sp. tritici]